MLIYSGKSSVQKQYFLLQIWVECMEFWEWIFLNNTLGDTLLCLHHESEADGYPVLCSKDICIPAGFSAVVRGRAVLSTNSIVVMSVTTTPASETWCKEGLYLYTLNETMGDVSPSWCNMPVSNCSTRSIYVKEGEVLAHIQSDGDMDSE